MCSNAIIRRNRRAERAPPERDPVSLHELRKNNYEKMAKENSRFCRWPGYRTYFVFWFLYGDLYSAKRKKKTQSHAYDSVFLTTHQKMSQLLISTMIQKKKPDFSALYVLG